MRLATGQFVTPTAIRDAVQQYLNPGLPAYPDFVAGEAVRSQLSPDGTTLAVHHRRPELALQTGRHGRCGQLDAVIFLYNVVGANKGKPRADASDQAGQRATSGWCSHRTAIRSTPPAAMTTRSMSTSGAAAASRPRRRFALGHFAPGAIGSARNKGVGLGVQPNASGMDISADGRDAGGRQQLQRLDQRHRHGHAHRPLRARSASAISSNNEGRSGGAGGTFPFAVVVMKGNGTAYVSSRPRP